MSGAMMRPAAGTSSMQMQRASGSCISAATTQQQAIAAAQCRRSACSALAAGAAPKQSVVQDAIASLHHKVQHSLRAHSITSVEELQRVHQHAHRADAARTQRFLMDVVGLREDEGALEALMALLGADQAELERAATLRRAEPHRALALACLAGCGTVGASLDSLHATLLASAPGCECTLEELQALLEDMEAQGLAQDVRGTLRCTDMALQLVQEACAAAAQQQQQRSYSGRKGQRQVSSLGAPRTGGLALAPTRAVQAAAHRAARGAAFGAPVGALTPSFAPMGAVAASRSTAASVLMSNSPQGSRGVDAEELRSLEELAQFERPVLDLLQNYSGLTLERLDGLLYMSTKEPRYNQGVARLQLLLEAMEAQGTISNDGGVYRYLRRTPEPMRRGGAAKRSPTPLAAYSNGNGNGSRAASSPSSSRSGAPRPNLSSLDEPLDLEAYEGRVLEVLGRYQVGLPLERLNNMMRMTPGNPRYDATPEQLQPLLARLVKEGKVQLDSGTYRVASYRPAPTAPSARMSPPAVRKSTPGGSSSSAPMADISTYEPAVLDLLQNYAGLSVQRLDTLLGSSAKAAGYRSSPGPLSQLLSRLVQEGKVDVDSNGTYRYKPNRGASPSSPRTSRSPQPSATSSSSSAPAPLPRLPPTPAGSRRRPTASPSGARMSDISAYESQVLELLQNYAGLSLERLDMLLASSGSRAPGYTSSPGALAGLLASLQQQGRVTMEDGVYRYRTSGRTPQAQRARSPSPTRGAFTVPKAASPSSAPSSLQFRAASPPPAPLIIPEDDWGAFENTIMTLMGNYGALPLERLQEMLQMSMVWPRYDRTPEQLASYLSALQAAGKVVSDSGLYRKAGTPAPARVARSTPSAPAAVPRNLAAAEGHVLSTLAAYPGLSLERLHNMLRLSKDGAAQDLEEDQLAALLSTLMAQGKVTTENGLYKAAPGISSRPPAPSSSSAAAARSSSSIPASAGTASRVRAVGPLSAEQAQLVDSLGFPTQDGLAGFTPFSEVWNGRWAMIGILASIIVEVRTGSGTLEQIGVQGLPSMELFQTLSMGAGAAVLGGTAITLFRFLTDKMDAKEKKRYASLLSGGSKEVDQPDRFYTDELKYARSAEITNGRAAMVGFLLAVIMEALTGRGVVGQAILYMKLLGVLGEDSGF